MREKCPLKEIQERSGKLLDRKDGLRSSEE